MIVRRGYAVVKLYVRNVGNEQVLRTIVAALVLAAAFGVTRLTDAAEGTIEPNRQHLDQIVDVRDVRADLDQVSGVLLNLSSQLVHDVRLGIDRSWLWADERHPGEAENDPGRSTVYLVPGEIPPGGRLPFTYRSDTPLPRRSDGRFETSVTVVGLETVD